MLGDGGWPACLVGVAHGHQAPGGEVHLVVHGVELAGGVYTDWSSADSLI